MDARAAATAANRPNGAETTNGAEAMVRMLQAYDVRHIFGLCGDTSLPFYDALFRLDHGIAHILTRDERSAAYMADGYARVSGRVGVCEGPSGGGATYIAPGLVEANESSVPVLALTTDIATRAAGRYALTELDQAALFRPLTKWNRVLQASADVPRMVRAAFRAMTTGRPGAAHIGFPYDVQQGPVEDGEIWAEPAHARYPAWRAGPDPAAVEAAIARLLAARRPVIVCGGGVILAGAEEALRRFAEALDIAVATSISGKGSLAETHPNCAGVTGSNGGIPATRALIDGADLVFFIGCRAGSVTTERWRSPKPGTPIIHLDSDPQAIGANYATEVALCGDAKLGLEALNAALTKRLPGFGGRAACAATWEAKRALFAKQIAACDGPIHPARVVGALNRLLPDNSVVVADPGTPCPFLSAHLRVARPGRRFFSNRAHGALGYALAAAVGAHYGRPDAKIVSVMGDGSFGFTSGEFETVVRKRLPITFIVFSNAAFGWIKAGQRAKFDSRFFSVDFTRTDHARVAEAHGLRAWRVERGEDLDAVLGKALAAGGPTLVDVISRPLDEAGAPVSEWVA